MAVASNTGSIVEVLKDFGWLINIGFVASLFGIALHLWKSVLAERDAREKTLEERLDLAKQTSLESWAERIRAIKEIQNWCDGSKDILDEMTKKLQTVKDTIRQEVAEEVTVREKLMTDYVRKLTTSVHSFNPISAEDLCGTWDVMGRNAIGRTYVGKFQVCQKGSQLQTTWIIGRNPDSEESYEGIGILSGRHFAVSFVRMAGDHVHRSEGVILYDILTPDIMRGKWTSSITARVCREECRKIS